jgi:hypothetical protein
VTWLQGSRRREQLVLVDRAFALLAAAERAGVRPDAPLWNALAQCAVGAGQLERAYQALSKCKPTARTFAILMDGCNQARRLPLPGCNCMQERSRMDCPVICWPSPTSYIDNPATP